jgi:hypothetical protein
VDPSSLPKTLGPLAFNEYHAPPADTVPVAVRSLAPPAVLAGHEAVLQARVVDRAPPDSVTLFLRPWAAGFYRPFPMHWTKGYVWSAAVPAATLVEGPHDFVITTYRNDTATTFPDGMAGKPYDWDYLGRSSWPLEVVAERTPLTLFRASDDASHLVFSRIGDAGRRGLFRVGLSPVTGAPVFHFELPVRPGGAALPDYTASLIIRDRIVARGASIGHGDSVRVRARGLGGHQVLHLTLMEDDGTSWTAAIPFDSTWVDRSLSLSAFTIGRGVLLPEGFPGEWNYWVGPAAGRGAAGDGPRLEHVERIQISLRPEPGVAVTPGSYGVELESVVLGLR